PMTAISASEDRLEFSHLRLGEIVKQGVLAALIVVALTIGLVGFRTVDAAGGLTVTTRFGDVIAAAVIAFIGRILVVLLEDRRARLVAPVAGALAVLIFIMLLGSVLFGDNVGRVLHALLPFNDPIVMWIVGIA